MAKSWLVNDACEKFALVVIFVEFRLRVAFNCCVLQGAGESMMMMMIVTMSLSIYSNCQLSIVRMMMMVI